MEKGNRLLYKQFFDQLANKLNIKNPKDWGNIRKRKIISEGGSLFIQESNGSVLKALQKAYPEINWKFEWFPRIKTHPIGFWRNKDNQRKFLSFLIKQNGLQDISELIQLPKTKIVKYGGSPLLSKYNNSWIQLLRALYPEYEWKEENLEHKGKGYWKSKENQLKFLNFIAKKYDIKEPQDWGKITTQDIIDNGGKSFLNQYQNSLVRTLKALLPEMDWENYSIIKPNGYWNDFQNKRRNLDKIAKLAGIQKPKDWGKMTIRRFALLGGKSLLKAFDGNLFSALQSIYTEIQWKREWFPSLPKYTAAHWNIQYNKQIFLEKIALEYNIQEQKDWSKVSISLIRKKGGGGLLMKYHNSLLLVLKSAFPNKNFDKRENLTQPQFQLYQLLK